jgi:hypothetical protein
LSGLGYVDCVKRKSFGASYKVDLLQEFESYGYGAGVLEQRSFLPKV